MERPSGPKTNKTLMRLLMLVLACIWGAVAYQVVDAVTHMEASTVAASRRPTSQIEREHFEYRADTPDPFTGLLSETGGGGVRKPPSPKPTRWIPPPVQLAGILTHKKKTTAVLIGPDGATYFLGAGDTLCGARILKVKGSAVAYLYKKRKAEWVLQ